MLAGYEASGFRAIELEPGANKKLFELAAQKLNGLAGQLKENGITFTLVILPYEMQTSRAAASRYAEMGVKWEAGFTEGSAQELLIRNLEPGVTVIDARRAFRGTESTSRVGEFFVYNLGDKMDWNHPNVQGHRRIADFLINQHVLPGEDRHAIVEERRP